MLEVKDLTVSAGGREIVHKVSFFAGRSENISLIGPNGAGKTTLLRALASLLPYSGKILAEDAETSLLSGCERAKRVSFVPQGAEVSGDIEARHFLELSRYPYREPWEELSKDDLAAIEKAAELTKTGDFLDRKIGTLSGGEKQRVLLAGAIAQDTPNLLLDEPLTYLDPVQRMNISEMIRKVAESGRTVLTVTHEINEALAFSDRILALSDGNLLFDGTPDGILNGNVLETLFGCRFEVVESAQGRLVFPVTNKDRVL